MPNVLEIEKLAKESGCSDVCARKMLIRRTFAAELRKDDNINDLADTLIRILNFEFEGDYDG